MRDDIVKSSDAEFARALKTERAWRESGSERRPPKPWPNGTPCRPLSRLGSMRRKGAR